MLAGYCRIFILCVSIVIAVPAAFNIATLYFTTVTGCLAEHGWLFRVSGKLFEEIVFIHGVRKTAYPCCSIASKHVCFFRTRSGTLKIFVVHWLYICTSRLQNIIATFRCIRTNNHPRHNSSIVTQHRDLSQSETSHHQKCIEYWISLVEVLLQILWWPNFNTFYGLLSLLIVVGSKF